MLETKYLITLIAVFISLVISLISLVISKENKTSEFREEWINELRNEISNYLSILHEFKTAWILFQNTNPSDNSIFFTDNLEKIREMKKYKENILFKLNDKDDQELIKSITEISNILDDNDKIDNDNLYEDEYKIIVSESKKLLKNEWKKVKAGEPFFRYAKKTFVGVVIIFFLFIIIATVKSLFQEKEIVVHKNITVNKQLQEITFYFEKRQLSLDKKANESSLNTLKVFFQNHKELDNKFFITIKGYSSNERLVNENKISNNYELSLARAENTKLIIVEMLKLNNISLQNIYFDIYGYSNENSTNSAHKDRKVEVAINQITTIENVTQPKVLTE